MQFMVYFAVVLASVFGVLLEMDVLVEPVQQIERTASIPMRPPPPVAQIPRAQTPDARTAAAPDAHANKATPRQAPAETAAAAQATDAPAATPDKTADAGPASHCDLRACAQAYHSFRAEDCTYQPYNGPRQLCSKGASVGGARIDVAADTAASLDAHADANAATSAAHCDINACADAYTTFNPVDCTYQPYDGPRRICSR